MQKNTRVTIHQYFNIPFRHGNGRRHANKCSYIDKLRYLTEVKNFITSENQYGHRIYDEQEMIVKACKFLMDCESYELFRMHLDLYQDEISEVAMFLCLMFDYHRDWLYRFAKEDPKALNRVAKDRDFAKTVIYYFDVYSPARNKGFWY